jgi:hypothetical protein
MTRPAAEIAADLADLACRQGALMRELAAALAAPAPAPACPAPAPAEYLTTADAARMLGVSVRHLERLRTVGQGPMSVKVGCAIRYHHLEIGLWAAQHKVTQTRA